MKWPPEPVSLQGSIVHLEPIEAQHRDDLLAASLEPEVWTWIDRRVPERESGFDAWFEARIATSRAGEQWCFATVDASRRVPVGSSSYMHVRPDHDSLEIGWTWLHPSAWRTGANVEAKLLMLQYAFEKLGCMRVEFKTDSRNQRSRTALAALPAQLEGILRKHMRMPGVGVRDSACFSILDAEWPHVRRNLERRLAAHGASRPRAAQG